MTEFVTARLNMKMMPLDRGAVFADPLHEGLLRAGYGEVTGGGTMMEADNTDISYVDVEIGLHTVTHDAVQFILTDLAGRGAAKGSKLIFDDGRDPIPFGRTEGLGLYLNGTDLPAEVYETSDVNELIDRLIAAIGQPLIFGYFSGPLETGLYFYKQSFAAMNLAIAQVWSTHPLCQKSRIAQIA